MRKHYYHLKDEVIEGTKLELLGKPDTVVLVVTAHTEDQAFELAMHNINMNNWQLDHVEE